MIQKLGQVMLYVENQDEVAKFWKEKMGFTIIADVDGGNGMRWIEMAPSQEAETGFVLHNKKLIAEMQPELNLEAPSLLFYTENLDQLHKDLSEKEVQVGEIMTMPTGRVFNFPDIEGNYFAVLEKK